MQKPLLTRDLPLGRGMDQKSARVAILLLLLIPLNVVDLNYTLFAEHIGMLHEMNPVANWFISSGLTACLVSYKFFLLLLGGWILWKVRQSALAGVASWVLVLVYVVLSAIWYEWVLNVGTMLEATMAMANFTIRHPHLR